MLSELIKKFEISNIEKHLIHLYLNNTNLDYKKSQFLQQKLDDFKPSSELYKQCSTLNLSDLKSLEKYLELLIPKQDRKLNGAYFTPTYIVDFIVNEVSPAVNEKCLDPSCGSGAFLIGLVEYFKRNYNKPVKNIVRENIFGADILAYNVERAKIILALFGLINNEIIDESDFNIEIKDSLKTEWHGKFDIIVGNPPYVRYQDLDDKNRDYLVGNWQSVKSGSFNLYFAFFELGYTLLDANGRLGYITPNNYFTSLAGVSLRQFFHEKRCITRIIDFSHRKIFDAQTYTAITFIRKNSNEVFLYDKINEGQECVEFIQKANGSPNDLNDLNVKKWRLLKKQEQKNIKIIETIGAPIKDMFNIAVGIATLRDEVFFVDSMYENNGLIRKITENGEFYVEKDITKPVYKISNFRNQEEIARNTLRIITPYDLSGKYAVPIPERKFKDIYPQCYNYLLSEREKLSRRDKGKAVFEPFYSWGRTQGIARRGKKILNPTFSKRPRFLVVEQDAYFTNGYGIYFKNIVKGLFPEYTHPLAKEENIYVLQKVLNSIVMEYYINTTSVSIQGGYPCYQKNFIEKFTIPEFSNKEVDILRTLNESEDIDSFLVEKYQLNIPVPNRLSYT